MQLVVLVIMKVVVVVGKRVRVAWVSVVIVIVLGFNCI